MGKVRKGTLDTNSKKEGRQTEEDPAAEGRALPDQDPERPRSHSKGWEGHKSLPQGCQSTEVVAAYYTIYIHYT